MDRRRAVSPVIGRQWSGTSSSTGSSSPARSPAHPHSRNQSVSGMSTIKKTQNFAAKAAAQRLAQVMASQVPDNGEDDDEDDDGDLGFRYNVPRPRDPILSSYSSTVNKNSSISPILSAPSNRSQSVTPAPAIGRNIVENNAVVRSPSAGRPSSVRTSLVPPSKISLNTTVSIPPIEPPPKQTSLKTTVSITPIEPPLNQFRRKGFPLDIGHQSSKHIGNQHEASALRDELDMLQEENAEVLDKLRSAEERRQQAEARAKELEKQVAALGEGVSLEAKLLTRKEAALRQREAALKAAKQNDSGRDEEIATLRSEIEHLKEETSTAVVQLHEVESEAKALRSMTQRMILTQEEKEELVLKRCWLARYWGLAVQHGICSDIAASKLERWSSLAALPLEVVLSAGQKAKEESWNKGVDDADIHGRDMNDLMGDENIESMLLVEKGLRELASLKVEDAVVLAFAQNKRPNLVRESFSDLKSPRDTKFMESFELNQEESDDVLFKVSWLTYLWRRAKVHNVEEDIAEDRLQFWISRLGQTPTWHDVVDVERGLVELRKLGIDQQLWEATRREIGHPSNGTFAYHKAAGESDI